MLGTVPGAHSVCFWKLPGRHVLHGYLFLSGMLKFLEEFPWSMDQIRSPKTTLLSQGSPHEYCPMVPAVPLLLLITKQNLLIWKIGQFSKKTGLLINL